MSQLDDKNVSIPTVTSNQYKGKRVNTTGYEEKNTYENQNMPNQENQGKAKLNLNAKEYIPKNSSSKVPLKPSTQSYVPASKQPLKASYNYNQGITYEPLRNSMYTPQPQYYKPEPQMMGTTNSYYPMGAQKMGGGYQGGYPTYKSVYVQPTYSTAPPYMPTGPSGQTQAQAQAQVNKTPMHSLNPLAPEFTPKKTFLNPFSKSFIPKGEREKLEHEKEEEERIRREEEQKRKEEEERRRREEEERRQREEEERLREEEEERRRQEEERRLREEEERRREIERKKEIEANKAKNIEKGVDSLRGLLESSGTSPKIKARKVYEKEKVKIKKDNKKSTEEKFKVFSEEYKKKKEKEKLEKIQKEKERKEEEERKRQERKKMEEEKAREEREREERAREERAKEEKAKEEEAMKKTIERNYFIISKDSKVQTQRREYSLEYMLQFKGWKICNESKLLTEMVISHLEDLKACTSEEKFQGGYRKSFKSGSNYDSKYKQKDDRLRKSQAVPEFNRGENAADNSNSMQQWGRKDITKELEMADKFKKKLDEIKQSDPVKFDLTELLNILTVDNYENTKKAIFEKIKEKTEYQEKFLDVLFKKAVHEKAFVNIYARLCKELDRDLPQRVDKISPNKKPTSVMRSKLLDKCREIFKMEGDTKLDHYFKADDEAEKEIKAKKFVLGNVNFIGELINIQLLSKKIVFQCIDNLFKRYEKQETTSKLKLINLEAIVILTDKFGTLINKQKEKIKKDDMADFESKLDNIIKKLNEVQEKGELPGYIKYKIINLIYKKEEGWEETAFEKNTVAKGKEEVRKAYEESQKISSSNTGGKKKTMPQEEVNDLVSKDLKDWRDFLDDGENEKDYQWEIITDLYNNKQKTIAEILTAFIESCIDFVQKKTQLDYANRYWNDLIAYYSKEMHETDKIEIFNTTKELICSIASLVCDNRMLLDVWANIIWVFAQYNVIKYIHWKDLENSFDEEEDLKYFFVIVKKVGLIDPKALPIFESFPLFKEDNKELYDSIVVEEEE